MIAVAQIGGHQAIVKEGEQIEVDKIDAQENSTIEFDTLLVSNEDGSDFQIGTPLLDGVKVTAKVLAHGRGDKIRVFKMKPRKRYRRVQGHRQDYTLVEITKIGAAKKAPAKKAETTEKKAEKKTETKKKTASKTTKTEDKK